MAKVINIRVYPPLEACGTVEGARSRLSLAAVRALAHREIVTMPIMLQKLMLICLSARGHQRHTEFFGGFPSSVKAIVDVFNIREFLDHFSSAIFWIEIGKEAQSHPQDRIHSHELSSVIPACV